MKRSVNAIFRTIEDWWGEIQAKGISATILRDQLPSGVLPPASTSARGGVVLGVGTTDAAAGNHTHAPAGGTTGARPGAPVLYQVYFDTTLGKPIWWAGAAWKDATGATV